MPDREKVIAMLKCIANLETVYVADCKRRECPYAGTECMRAVATDALALLKKQEERIKFLEKWTAYLEGGDPYEGNGVLSHD